MQDRSTGNPAVPPMTSPSGTGTDTALDLTLEFKPTLRRQGTLVATLVAVFGIAMTFSASGALAPFAPAWRAFAMLAVAIPAIWLTVVVLRQARSQKPVVRLNRLGISGATLREPVAWSELEDAVLDRGSGAARLRLLLKPDPARPDRRSFLSGHNPARPQISLHMLDATQQQDVFYAIHARLGVLRTQSGAGLSASLREVRADEAFEDRLDMLTPRPWGLYAMVGANVLVWAMNVAAGISPTHPSSLQLFGWGANSASSVVVDGEWWRLVTATFLHGGLMHIAFNMLGLWDAGQQLCRLLGNRQFLLIYLAAALCGSAASLHYTAQFTTSVGASGAVFGVLGALLAASFKHRRHLPAYNRGRLWTGLGIFLAYSLVNGFTTQGVDNAAHVGGLIGGLVLGLLLRAPFDTECSDGERHWLAGLGIAGTAGVVTTAVLATPIPAEWTREAMAMSPALHSASQRFETVFFRQLPAEQRRVQNGELTEVQFMQNAERTIVPPCRDIISTLAPIRMPMWEPAGRAAYLYRRICENSIASLQIGTALARRDPRLPPDAPQQLARLASDQQQLMRELTESRRRPSSPGSRSAAERKR